MSAKTEQAVATKVRALHRERDGDTSTIADLNDPTVGEWTSHWLENIAPRRVRARTLETYRTTLRLHVVPGLGGVPLHTLQPEHLEQLYTQLEQSGLSPSTVLRVHRIIGRVLQVAYQRERTRRNVARLVDPPKQRPSEVARPLRLSEAQAVLTAARRHRNAARWDVAIMLGLRQSEALALRWSDVDLRDEALMVRRTQHHVRGQGVVYEDPKTSRARRRLALPSVLTARLSAHRADQLVEQANAGAAWVNSDLVFARPDGRPITKHADYDAWCRLLRQAGVAHARLHDARHTAATLLLAEGVQTRVVMELLGHSQMRTTTDTYSHVMPALAREAAERMALLFSGPSSSEDRVPS